MSCLDCVALLPAQGRPPPAGKHILAHLRDLHKCFPWVKIPGNEPVPNADNERDQALRALG